ncbi:MAG: hypothetical protein Q9168_003206 [Polycauliona sp. 1 TL-2023]
MLADKTIEDLIEGHKYLSGHLYHQVQQLKKMKAAFEVSSFSNIQLLLHADHWPCVVGQALKERHEVLETDHRVAMKTLKEEREERHLEEEQRYLDRLTVISHETGQKFVAVLIDADYYKFCSEYLRDEEDGGRLAAEELRAQTWDYIQTYWSEPLPTNVVILACANLSGLGGACWREMRADTQDLRPFAGEFNAQHTQNIFVDVGPGKQRADDKIQGW